MSSKQDKIKQQIIVIMILYQHLKLNLIRRKPMKHHVSYQKWTNISCYKWMNISYYKFTTKLIFRRIYLNVNGHIYRLIPHGEAFRAANE